MFDFFGPPIPDAPWSYWPPDFYGYAAPTTTTTYATGSALSLIPADPTASPRSRNHQNKVASILNSLIRQGILVQKSNGEWDFQLSSDHVTTALGYTPPSDTISITSDTLSVGGTLSDGLTVDLPSIITPSSFSLDPPPVGGSISVDQYGRVYTGIGGTVPL